VDVAADVVKGVAFGCEMAGCALIGGETAEMPGMYDPNEYDLAGFAVGLVERDRVIDGTTIAAGDTVIGLESSGPHSNGYSLIRKIVATKGGDYDELFDGRRKLGEALIEPTRIYVKPVLHLFTQVAVKGIAHITGGGLVENIPRVIPENLCARIERGSWKRPAIFDWLQRNGHVDEAEMARTFNCGIGMVVVVSKAEADKAVLELRGQGVAAHVVGSIVAREPGGAQAVIV
jgi:phosphoribosylformylglycinamidine cyclo-ligase